MTRLRMTLIVAVAYLVLQVAPADAKTQTGPQQPYLQQNDSQQQKAEPAQKDPKQQPAKPAPKEPTPEDTMKQMEEVKKALRDHTSTPQQPPPPPQDPNAPPPPPEPALRYEPGLGVLIAANFLQGGGSQASNLEIGLLGAHLGGPFRVNEWAFGGLGFMFSIPADGKSERNPRVCLTVPLVSMATTKHSAWSVSLLVDPWDSKVKFGAVGGFSFIWKQQSGKLRPPKPPKDPLIPVP